MISNDGHVAHLEFVFEASRGIGDEDHSNAEASHDLHGENDGLHGVAFVAVEAASEANGGEAVEGADDHFAVVAGDCAVGGKAGDLVVGDGEARRGFIVVDGVGEGGEARAADDSDGGRGDFVLLELVEDVGGGVAVGEVGGVEGGEVGDFFEEAGDGDGGEVGEALL